MKQLPADPFAFQAAVFDALCDDLLDMGKSRSFARTDALREISKQHAESLGDAVPARSGGLRPEPVPVSALRAPAAIARDAQ